MQFFIKQCAFFIIGHLRSITTTHVTSVARNSRGLNTWHGTKCYTPERGHLNAPNVRVNSRERINSDTSEFLLFTSSIYTFTLNIQFFSRKLSLKKQGHMVFFMGNSSNQYYTSENFDHEVLVDKRKKCFKFLSFNRDKREGGRRTVFFWT